MTQVDVDLRKPQQDGTDVAKKGTLECVPTARRNLPDWVTLPERFTAKLVDGKATLELAPTLSGVWAWQIHERTNAGKRRTVAVPSVGPVKYGDLVDVDPASLEPDAEPQPIWDLNLAAEVEAREAADAELAEQIEGLPSLPIAQADVTGLPAVVQEVADAQSDASEALSQTAFIYGQLLTAQTDIDTVEATLPNKANSADVYSKSASDTRVTVIGDAQYVGGVAVIGGSGTTDDRAALVTADSAASSSRPILFRGPGTYRIASNFTTTAPVIVQPGAKIKPDNGVVVKVGRVLASDGQCFDHSAGGVVAPTRVDYYLPQWWGATGGADDTAAWSAANAAATAVKFTDSVTARDMMQRLLAPTGMVRLFGLTINSCTIVADKGSTTFAPPTSSTTGTMLTLGPLASVRGGYWRSNNTGAATLISVQGARSIVSDAIVEPRASGSTGVLLGSGSSLTPTITNTEIIGSTKAGTGLVVNSADAKMSDLTIAQCALGIDWQRGAARVVNLHAWGNGTGMSGNPDGIEGADWFVESNDGWGIDWNSADLNMLTNLRLWNNGAGSAGTGGMRLLHSGFGTRGNKIDCVLDDNVGDGLLVDGSSANIITAQVVSRLRNAGSAAVQTNGVRITAASSGGAVSAGNKVIAKGRSTDVTGSVVSNASASTDIDLGSVKAVMPTDVVVNNTVSPSTLVGVPMERGEKWLIEGVVMVDGAQASDFKLRLQATGLTAATGRFALNSAVGASNTSLTAASMNPSNAQPIATTGGTYVASGALGIGVAQAVTISGYVETGTADGTLELHGAQNTADPTNTTFRAGSWIRGSRIA